MLDDTISIENVIGRFILPLRLEHPITGALLAVEWPWFIHVNRMERHKLRYRKVEHEAMLTDLVPIPQIANGSMQFSLTSEDWAVIYEASVQEGRLRYRCAEGDDEVVLVRPQSEQRLSEWLNDNGMTFILDEDRLIDGDLLYRPTWPTPSFDKAQLVPLDWEGVDLTKESQKAERHSDSIQYRVAEYLMREAVPWEVLIDDDGSGEIADLVAMRVDAIEARGVV